MVQLNRGNSFLPLNFVNFNLEKLHQWIRIIVVDVFVNLTFVFAADCFSTSAYLRFLSVPVETRRIRGKPKGSAKLRRNFLIKKLKSI